MLSALRLVRHFGARVAVDDVTFEVRPGEVFGLLGPNGAGKTTTLRMLGGLILPTLGAVRIDGVVMDRASAAGLRARIGFLTETPGLWDQLTVADNLAVYARLFRMEDVGGTVERALRRFDLWDRRGDRAALLSKGMKQKLALARALVHDPEIVLLDEPTANLDPEASRAVRDLLLDLRRRGRTVVVSTHNLDEIERMADRVALISTRLVAVGEPSVLRRRMFGARLRVRLTGTNPPVPDLLSAAERAGARDVRTSDDQLSMIADDPDVTTPAIIRALVGAGANIREASDDRAPLEEVYVRLLDAKSHPAPPHATGIQSASVPPTTHAAGISPEGGSNRHEPERGIANEVRTKHEDPGTRHEPAPGAANEGRTKHEEPGTRHQQHRRVATLIGKELRELRSNPAAIVPVAILIVACIAVPFLVIVAIPRLTGENLSADRSMRQVVALAARTLPSIASLPPDAAVQAFLFQQFLLLFLMTPIVGAVSLAAYSVVGEKQGRTLEPLLTTPVTTAELLVAKVLAAFLPSIAIEAIGLAGYIALVAAFGARGVADTLLTARSFILVGLVGPMASLAALQMTIAVSSRVNDPRSAQQIAVLVVLPLVMMLVGQIAGAFIITTPMLLLVALGLAALWSILIVFSVALFERETILTRWK